MIQVYYGYGKGKTSAAIGAGMRAKGAGKSVLLVQFLKDNKSSELSVLPFEIYEAPESLPFNPDKSYLKWVEDACKAVAETECDVVILDEFLDVIPEFVALDDAVQTIKMLSVDLNKEVFVTGHKEQKEIFDVADYLTYFEKIKHPYDLGVKARKGIEY